MKKIGLLSDTHGFLDPRVMDFFSEADQIWHAGDIGSIGLADRLKDWKELKAVHGNIDDYIVRLQYHETEVFESEGLKVLMMHIGGYPGHYDTKAKRLIETVRPGLFVCGHSHILRIIYDKTYDMLTINPGAAGKSGFHQVQTCVRFTIDAGTCSNMEILELQRTAGLPEEN